MFLDLPGIETISWLTYVAGAVVIGVTMFLLITFKLEHPSSADVALGFVINPWNWQTPLNLFLAIVFLVIFRYGQKKVFQWIEQAKS